MKYEIMQWSALAMKIGRLPGHPWGRAEGWCRQICRPTSKGDRKPLDVSLRAGSGSHRQSCWEDASIRRAVAQIQPGCAQSEEGNRWVERILSLRQTCRLQKKTTFPVLVEALRAYFRGQEPDLASIAQPTLW